MLVSEMLNMKKVCCVELNGSKDLWWEESKYIVWRAGGERDSMLTLIQCKDSRNVRMIMVAL